MIIANGSILIKMTDQSVILIRYDSNDSNLFLKRRLNLQSFKKGILMRQEKRLKEIVIEERDLPGTKNLPGLQVPSLNLEEIGDDLDTFSFSAKGCKMPEYLGNI
jgi:hypothetical protein